MSDDGRCPSCGADLSRVEAPMVGNASTGVNVTWTWPPAVWTREDFDRAVIEAVRRAKQRGEL